MFRSLISSFRTPVACPRWGDAEFQVVPDASYHSLLTDGNNSADPTSEFFPGKFGDIKGADYSAGVLGVETDQFLLPSLYRPKQGDRVAVFGRWIVDCGHPDFHTEIHPPLLTARAWTVNQLGACAKESMPNPLGVPSGYATCVRVSAVRISIAKSSATDRFLFTFWVSYSSWSVGAFLSSPTSCHA